MKKILLVCIALLTIAAFPSTAYAGTSFIVYSEHAIYGVNLDINETELAFRIVQREDIKTFLVEYTWLPMYNGVSYLPIVSMNDRGFFCSSQALPSVPLYSINESTPKIEIGDLAQNAAGMQSVTELMEIVQGQLLVNSQIALHALFADINGDAAILEAGDAENIARTEGGFVVMTGVAPDSGYSPDSKAAEDIIATEQVHNDIAFAYINQHADSFGILEGFQALKLTAQQWRGGGTMCSLVFDPEAGNIYIALNGDFDKIWKASLQDGMVSTWSGFDKPAVYKIGTGISSDDLLHPKGFWEKNWLYLAALFMILVWVFVGTALRRARIKKFKPKQLEW